MQNGHYEKATYEAAFKAKVTLKAVKGEKTAASTASKFGLHPTRCANGRISYKPAAKVIFRPKE